MHTNFALFYIFWVPASRSAKSGCHPATVLDWKAALAASKKQKSPSILLDWDVSSSWGPSAEQYSYQSGRATTNAAKQSQSGNVRRLDDNSQFAKFWTETGGMCVDIDGKKAPHYHKQLGTKNDRVDCQKSCEDSYGCEAFAIHLEVEAGQLWVTSCSLYGKRVVPPQGFQYVAGEGKSEAVRGDFPKSGANYPVRCFVRVPDTPVTGSAPSKQSVVADAGRPAELQANLQLKNNREATASYLQLQGSVLTIQDSILEITGDRALCAPADGECDIANVDTGSQIKVINTSTYVSPSDTVVQPRVVQVTCPESVNRKTEVSCHADGTWHAATSCPRITTVRPHSSSTSNFHVDSAVHGGTTNTAHLQNTNTVTMNILLIIIVSVVGFLAIVFVAVSAASVLCRRKRRVVTPLQNLPHTSVELDEVSRTRVDSSSTYDKVEFM